jgi:hypothetical protein
MFHTYSHVDKYWSLDLSLSQQIHYSCWISPHQTSERFLLSYHTHFLSHHIRPITQPFFTFTVTPTKGLFYTYSPVLTEVSTTYISLLIWGLRSRYDWRSVSQSISMSWYRVPIWDLRTDIISCRNVAFWNLQSCICGVPSLTRGWVCNLQCNHSMVRVAQNSIPYFTVSSENSPTWRARFRIYIPQEKGGPVIPLGTGFPLCRLLRLVGLWWRYSNPPPPGERGPCIYSLQEQDGPVQSEVNVKSKSRYDQWPVNQYVQVSSPLGIIGVPSEKFQFDIRKCTFFLKLFLLAIRITLDSIS